MPQIPRRSFLKACAGALGGLAACGGGAFAPAAEARGRRFALLVGVTHYPKWVKNMKNPLEGPANDVGLLSKVLKERFDFRDPDIVALTEKTRKPTRAAIEGEFLALAKKVRPGDAVVVLLSGHGSQQPEKDPPDPDYPEPDGLDEIFLPADIGPWDGKKGTVRNAIIDDEVRLWARAITDKGASLFLIADCCHSGTILRGAGDEVERSVPPDSLVSEKLLKEARERAAGRDGGTRGPAGEPSSLKMGKRKSVVALYAAQPDEQTYECPMPWGDDDPKAVHGLLTYAVCQVLTRAEGTLTYAELARRVPDEYLAWGRTKPSPVPFAEGTDLDREVLGEKRWPGRSALLLRTKDRDPWEVTGGKLLGLYPGTVLAVYPRAGDRGAGRVLGHVRVTRSDPFTAQVEPCAYGGVKPSKSLPDGTRAEVVYLVQDLKPLRVLVGEVPAKDRRAVEGELRKLAGEKGTLVELARDLARANWVVRGEGGKLFLAAPASQGPRLALGRERLADDLREVLGRVARAQNLLAVAAGLTEERRGERQVHVEVVLQERKGADDRKGRALEYSGRAPRLKPGQWIGFRVINKGEVKADVTLLFVDSEYKIQALFPDPEEKVDNRLPPGGVLVTDSWQVNAETVGLEHLVLIAVEGSGPQVDFSSLAQPEVGRARGARTRGGRSALDTPLGKLFEHALFRSGGTRGAPVSDNNLVRALAWQVEPAGKAADK